MTVDANEDLRAHVVARMRLDDLPGVQMAEFRQVPFRSIVTRDLPRLSAQLIIPEPKSQCSYIPGCALLWYELEYYHFAHGNQVLHNRSVRREPHMDGWDPAINLQHVSTASPTCEPHLTIPCYRFEKSLYDLIRGLRNHKGNEKEYIQNSLKECRIEIRGSDMGMSSYPASKDGDLLYSATGRRQGHGASQARIPRDVRPRHVVGLLPRPRSHVLAQVPAETSGLPRSCTEFPPGYRGLDVGDESFEKGRWILLKEVNRWAGLIYCKDLTATSPPTMSLPIIALPHIINSSLALSVLSDLLPRLTHSHPAVRKKTIVTLYRLALVYPETLKAAWPKIKERLMDENEDPSVTAAIVNVVCELGWRRPQDFLSLAPRLFELLVDSGNNWMAIKLIKLVCETNNNAVEDKLTSVVCYIDPS